MGIRGGAEITLRAAALALAGMAAACAGGEREQRAAVEIKGTNPASGAPAATAAAPAGTDLQPNAQGIVTYEGYQTVVAGSGDTVADLAARVGMSASELAAYNGLTPGHELRAGDELVLPPRPGGYGEATVASAAPPLSTMTAAPPPESSIETTPLPGAGAEPADAGADASGEGWSPAMAAAAIERSTGINDDGSLAAPPSSTEPVPPEPEHARELASPDLRQYQTGGVDQAAPPPGEMLPTPGAGEELASAPPQLSLQKPVDGPVAVPFQKGTGPARNDGVDFAAPAGAPVLAAADGEVALVSESLGGLGTIVLLRHPDDLLTVYGRIDDVSVAKGDMVRRGQQIGVVSDAAAPAEPRMHFEVRRGAESLDPMQFL